MKILLISPPITVYEADLTTPGNVVPLGIAYIASYVRETSQKDGWNCDLKILDCLAESQSLVTKYQDKSRFGFSDEQILEKIKEYQPDVVGVSCQYTAYAADAHNVCKVVKAHNPNIFVVLGGAHCSISPEIELKDNNVDAVVFGEGEETFYELVHGIATRKKIENIQGLAIRTNHETINKNINRTFIKDLDKLPFPARDLLDMPIYLDAGLRSSNLMRKPATTIITSRGCPYQCSFCSIHSVWGYGWRARSPKNVVDEIEYLTKEYDVKEIHFLDDNIGINRERLKNLCEEIIRRKVDIKWTTPNGIAHWLLTEEILDLMKASGCYRITFGIESGSEQTRKFIGKDPSHAINLDQALRTIDYANKIGIWTISTFILGFPDERLNDIIDTINFSIKSDLDLAVFYLAGPFPGTKLYDVAKMEGLLDWDFIDVYDSTMPEVDYSKVGRALGAGGFDTKHFTYKQLQTLQAYAYKKFFLGRIKGYMNLIKIVRKIRSIEDVRFTARVFIGLMSPIITSIRGKNARVASQTINKQASKGFGQHNELRPHIQND